MGWCLLGKNLSFLGMVSALFRRGSYFGVWPGLYAEQAAVKVIRIFARNVWFFFF